MEYKSIIEMNNHELLEFMIDFCREMNTSLNTVTTGNLSHKIGNIRHGLINTASLVESVMLKNDKDKIEETYELVRWPESQLLMEHPRFHECLFVDNIEGHDDVGSSAYMCPIDLYEELFITINNY